MPRISSPSTQAQPWTLTPFLPSGPLSELHYPIDSLTKKPKGFAFVTFMFPEHAVKAYAEVDGQVFQVMPGKLAGGCWAQVTGEAVCACASMRHAPLLPSLEAHPMVCEATS